MTSAEWSFSRFHASLTRFFAAHFMGKRIPQRFFVMAWQWETFADVKMTWIWIASLHNLKIILLLKRALISWRFSFVTSIISRLNTSSRRCCLPSHYLHKQSFSSPHFMKDANKFKFFRGLSCDRKAPLPFFYRLLKGISFFRSGRMLYRKPH